MNHNNDRTEPEKNKHGVRIQEGKERKEKILDYNIYERKTTFSVLKFRGTILVCSSTVRCGHCGNFFPIQMI